MGVIVMAAHFALWVFANASVRRFRGAQAYSARKDAADRAASGAKDAGASGRNGCFESAPPPKRRLTVTTVSEARNSSGLMVRSAALRSASRTMQAGPRLPPFETAA